MQADAPSRYWQANAAHRFCWPASRRVVNAAGFLARFGAGGRANASGSGATPNQSFNGTASGSPLTPTLGVCLNRKCLFWVVGCGFERLSGYRLLVALPVATPGAVGVGIGFAHAGGVGSLRWPRNSMRAAL